MEANDNGPIIRHGSGPAKYDYLGAREAISFEFGDTYYLHYDGTGPTGSDKPGPADIMGSHVSLRPSDNRDRANVSNINRRRAANHAGD